ncbi:MAG: holo-ACP synthase [bacterium]|nr:holo-ACP synthase [bacterium]
MIEGLGVDVIEVKRIKEATLRWKDHFLKRVFTKKELAYCQKKPNIYQHLAARFAAKEAVLKAFGVGLGKIHLKDIEVIRNHYGKPDINLLGQAKQFINKGKLLVTLSHCKEYAIAQAIYQK